MVSEMLSTSMFDFTLGKHARGHKIETTTDSGLLHNLFQFMQVDLDSYEEEYKTLRSPGASGRTSKWEGDSEKWNSVQLDNVYEPGTE